MPAPHNGTCVHLSGYMENGKQILVWPRVSMKKKKVVLTGNPLLHILIQKFYLYYICDVQLCLVYTQFYNFCGSVKWEQRW